jgi:hypothetical protein
MAFMLVFLLTLPLLAQPISALIVNGPNSTGGVPDSSAGHDNNGRNCPMCGCLMKPCPPDSVYKWVCHNCGYYVLR